MISRLLSKLVILVVLQGCGQYFRSTHDPGRGDERREELNDLLAHRTCIVVLGDGTRYAADGVILGRDSIILHDTLSRRTFTLPNRAVRRVTFVDRMRGGIDGMTLGAGIGLGLYAGGVFLSNQANTDNRGYLFLGALAIPAGFLTGSLIGHRHEIDFSPSITDSTGSAAE